jgi:RNA polymerase sigma-70 factor (ECF subfamily)
MMSDLSPLPFPLPAEARAAARRNLLAHLIHERELLLCDAMRILGARDQAEDVLQEAAIRCLNSPAIHPEIDCLRAMLRRIVRNLALDQQRRHARSGGDTSALAEPACLRPGPEQSLADRQSLQAVLGTLRTLPPRHQRIFRTHRLGARHQNEIARDEGLSPARVHAIIVETHARLSQSLATDD